MNGYDGWMQDSQSAVRGIGSVCVGHQPDATRLNRLYIFPNPRNLLQSLWQPCSSYWQPAGTPTIRFSSITHRPREEPIMKERTRRMLEIAQTIPPDVVCRYAEKLGWKLLQVGWPDLNFCRLPEPEDTQVIVPLKQSFADYPNRILT